MKRNESYDLSRYLNVSTRQANFVLLGSVNNWFIRQRASYLDERTADVWNQLFYNIFNLMENFFSRGICLLTMTMSVHDRNMKQARAIEFDYTNLFAML